MATTRKRNVEIEFIVDDKAAGKALGNIDKKVTKTGQSFANFGRILAGSVVADRILDFAQASIASFSDLNESINAVEVTFGGAAQGIKQLGEEAAQSVGLSNAEFNSLAVGFSAFAEEIARGTGTTVVPVIDDLTTRIADFASVMNLDVAEAADKFRSGLAGETEPLRKFGIDVSAAAVQQEALALGLGDSSGKLSEQDKILARYSLIMKQTDKTAGDFQNTSDQLANQQRILAAETENAKAKFGEGLTPAMEAAQKTGNDLLVVLGHLAGMMSGEGGKSFFSTVAQGAGDLFNVLTLGVVPALGAYADHINNAEQAAKDLAQAQMDALAPSEAQVEAAERADEKYFDLAETMGELADNTDDAATAQQKLTDKQKEAADPAFKLFNALDKYDEAERNYAEAVAEFGEKSDQAEEAAIDLGLAKVGLNEAGADYAAEGGRASLEALVAILESAGVADATIRGIVAAIELLNGTPINNKPVWVPGVGTVDPSLGGTIGGNGNLLGFAEGGVVPGPKGAPVPALVHGGEMVLNPDQQAALKTGAPGTLVTINTLSLSNRMLQEIQEMARRQ